MSNEFNIELGLQVKQSDIERIQKELNTKIGNIDIRLDISNGWFEKIHTAIKDIKPIQLNTDTKKAEASINRFKDDMQHKLENIDSKITVDDLGSFNKIKKEVNELSTETENSGQKMRDLRRDFVNLSDVVNRGKPLGIQVNSNISITELEKSLSNIGYSEVTVNRLNEAVLKGSNSWRTFTANAANADGTIKQIKGSINTSTGEIRVLENELKKTEKTTNSLGLSASKMIGYFISFSTVISLIRSAFNNMKAIDTQLTELAKVTDLVRTGFQQASLEAVEAGNKWGRTAEDYLKASTTFAQSGVKDFEQLADVALLAQSAGSLTAELASDYLIATNAAFKLGNNAEKLTEILDSQNKVSNLNAINMTEMANATRNYANTAAITGETVQSMTALITTGVASTKKSGDEIGNALKSITLNIAQIKGEVDGEIIDESSMAKAEKALHGVGIATRTVKDGIVELKTTSSVLSELSQKFQNGEISAEKLSVILNDVSGKHRADILAAIVQNFDQYTKAMEDYTNSAGSAAREAQKDIESWDGKLNILSNTWTGFVAKTIDTEWIKGFLDSGTKAIGVLESIVSLLNTPVGKAGLIAILSGLTNRMAPYAQNSKCA